jgi:hypothetical protein
MPPDSGACTAASRRARGVRRVPGSPWSAPHASPGASRTCDGECVRRSRGSAATRLSSSLASSDSRRVKKLSTTKSAMRLPDQLPLVSSKRKWTPANTRLRVASSAAAERLSNDRVTPGIMSEYIWNGLGAGAVILAECQSTSGHGLPDANTFDQALYRSRSQRHRWRHA